MLKTIYRLKYRYGKHFKLSAPVDVSLELSSYCTNNCGYCYHAEPRHMPFARGHMKREIAYKVIKECAEIGVNSIKFNYRGESTINPIFEDVTAHAKRLAEGMTFIDRVTNTNMNFKHDREDIFRGLCNQTKVKISFDSFRREIFEKQRKGSSFHATLCNIYKLYNYPRRKNNLVIQAVRTELNSDEDLRYEIKKRWPDAIASIRDVVSGRTKEKKYNVIKNRGNERQSCLQAHVRLIVAHNGMVQICCPDIASSHVIGNAGLHHISDIFNSSQAVRIRERLKDGSAFRNNEACRTCPSFESYKGYKHPWGS